MFGSETDDRGGLGEGDSLVSTYSQIILYKRLFLILHRGECDILGVFHCVTLFSWGGCLFLVHMGCILFLFILARSTPKLKIKLHRVFFTLLTLPRYIYLLTGLFFVLPSHLERSAFGPTTY